MSVFVVDTNVVTALARSESTAFSHFEAAVAAKETVLLCPVVLYEVERGLQAQPLATRKRKEFTDILPFLTYHEFTEPVWREAATLWASARSSGQPHADDDVLIAAFSIVHNAVLVTRNGGHFRHFGVTVVDWM